MTLDNFDRMVLGQTGDASEIMLRVYNKPIKKNNAEKQLAGIRTHLRFRETIDEEQGELKGQLRSLKLEDGGKRILEERIIEISEGDLVDTNAILKAHGYDPGKWTLKESKQTAWHSPLKGGKKQELYSSHIKVEPIKEGISTNVLEEVFDELAKRTPRKSISAPRGRRPHGYLLEFPIMDLHLGKLAWSGETEEDYDLKIAEALFRKVITDLVESVHSYDLDIEKIVFPIGQDFFHFDTSSSTTTKGTQMDTDTRWQKLFRKGVFILAWAIEELAEIAPVDVLYVPGNHDRMLGYFVTATMEAYFRNDKYVNVDMNGTPRKYMRYGQVLLGWAHGADERNRIEDLMQIEAAEDWGKTTFREFHLGHIHHEEAKEKGGVVIRNIGSITAVDAWHKNTGFVGNVRKAQAFIWDRKRGKIMTLDFNILPDDIKIEIEQWL